MKFKHIQAVQIQKEVRRFQKRFEIETRKERDAAARVIQNRCSCVGTNDKICNAEKSSRCCNWCTSFMAW